jgi:hypothetical protein
MSVAMIDATYGHLVPDSEEFLHGLLDDYDTKPLLESLAASASAVSAARRDDG